MKEVLISPPRTVMQVFKTLPEGTLAEVINDNLYMSPAPNPFHQRVSINLSTDLNLYVRENNLGEVYASAVDLYLDDIANAVQPDILFIAADNPLVVDKEGLHGVPDLIIEILSPGNKDHDRITKKALYEKFGVKEYWIVDPETTMAAGFLLEGQAYLPLGEFHGQIKSTLLQKEFNY